MDTGLLILRLVVGLLLAGHGAQKLFGWFGGHGIEGTGGFFHGLGYRPGKRWAVVAGLSEFGGGALLALGLFTPLAAAAILGTMFNAVMSVHAKNGPWLTNNGWEYNLVLAASAVAVAFTGPGEVSLDYAFGWELAGTDWGIAALALGVGAGIVTDIYRRVANREAKLRSRDVQATA
ncbi:MAG: putative oxidoreductase [Acidimicrobiaceae bacterium]|jgi:putative oxidoreductase